MKRRCESWVARTRRSRPCKRWCLEWQEWIVTWHGWRWLWALENRTRLRMPIILTLGILSCVSWYWKPRCSNSMQRVGGYAIRILQRRIVLCSARTQSILLHDHKEVEIVDRCKGVSAPIEKARITGSLPICSTRNATLIYGWKESLWL
jgi:hypothetical protein